MKTIRILIFLFIFTNFILLGFLFSQFTGKVVYETEKANLTRVIDGDTIDTSIGKVRLLGINTPEKNEKGYEEAKLFLLELEGREIELIKTNEDKDKYSRLLRYVFFRNKNINKEILEKGFAHIYVYEKDDFYPDLKKAEDKARKQKLGIWQRSSDVCVECIILTELNYIDPGEYVLLENSCNFTCNLQGWIIKDDATHIKKLDFFILAGQNKKVDYEGRIWNDEGDSLYLRDEKGFLVLFYRY